MRLAKLAICLLILPLFGCLRDGESFYVPSDLGLPIGGAAVRPAQPQQAPGNQAPATGASKMMQDPEASESYGSDYVWADDEATARAMCERIAARNGWRLDDVQDAGGFAMQTGKKRFTCYYTMFGEPR